MNASLEDWIELLPEVEESLPAPGIVYRDNGRDLTDEQVDRLAGLLSMVWKEGKRHALALAVSGMLVKGGYCEKAATTLVYAVCLKTSDSAVTDRIKAVDDTYRAAALGQPVMGWRGIEGELGADSVSYLKSIFGGSGRPPPEPDREDDPYKMPFRLTERRSFPSFPMLIEGILPCDPRGSVCYLTGLSQSFKSYLALDWAGHISQGMNWHGYETTKAQVLYVAAEGSYKDILSRLRAWEAHNETQAQNLYCRLSPVNILDPDAVDRNIAMFEKDDNFAPRLVILDTLSQCAGSADENSSKDARAIYANCKKFGAAFGSTVLVVHHAGKSEGAIARGSSAYFDDSDAVIQMVRPSWQTGGLDCTMHLKKIKSGKLVLNHEMNARVVEWEEGVQRGRDLVLVQKVLRSAFENKPQLF